MRLITAFLVICLFACNKEDDANKPKQFSGTVLRYDTKEPLANATVYAQEFENLTLHYVTQLVQTDEQGKFHFSFDASKDGVAYGYDIHLQDTCYLSDLRLEDGYDPETEGPDDIILYAHPSANIQFIVEDDPVIGIPSAAFNRVSVVLKVPDESGIPGDLVHRTILEFFDGALRLRVPVTFGKVYLNWTERDTAGVYYLGGGSDTLNISPKQYVDYHIKH
jgi:hypothetical protein